jgi:hypothetical protein
MTLIQMNMVGKANAALPCGTLSRDLRAIFSQKINIATEADQRVKREKMHQHIH